jgi:carbonic anhydrase
MSNDRMEFNRAAFLAAGVAAMAAGLPKEVGAAGAAAATPAGAGLSPEALLGVLMAGNRRFVENDFPPVDRIAERRTLLTESQAPFAAILGCADSRVVPNLVFVEGVGDLFVVRVAGNFPDDLVIGSIEYAVEHLGTRLIMVLGHQNCGAVTAVYSAIKTKTPLPPHLSAIEKYIAPGIEGIVAKGGSQKEAIEVNAQAAAAALKAQSPTITKGIKSGKLLVTSGVYQLGSGEVVLL